jgi:hypothetical protein
MGKVFLGSPVGGAWGTKKAFEGKSVRFKTESVQQTYDVSRTFPVSMNSEKFSYFFSRFSVTSLLLIEPPTFSSTIQ